MKHRKAKSERESEQAGAKTGLVGKPPSRWFFNKSAADAWERHMELRNEEALDYLHTFKSVPFARWPDDAILALAWRLEHEDSLRTLGLWTTKELHESDVTTLR